jgi:hypothetical protein
MGMIQQTDMESVGRVWEGTWESVGAHAAEFTGHRVRVIVLDIDPERTTDLSDVRISARGKYAGLLSSEDIIRSKQEDIAIEERPR